MNARPPQLKAPPRLRRHRPAGISDISGILCTGTGGARARRPRRSAAPLLDITGRLFAPSAHTRRRHAFTTPGPRVAGHESCRKPAAAAPAAAIEPQHARTRHTAPQERRACSLRADAGGGAASLRPHARTTTNDDEKMLRSRKVTTAQRRRRWSVGHGDTGSSPWQRGGRLVPLMRARLIPSHGLATRPRLSLALWLLLHSPRVARGAPPSGRMSSAAAPSRDA